MIWLALALLFLVSTAISFFITLGVLPKTSAAEPSREWTAANAGSTPQASPSQEYGQIAESTPSPTLTNETKPQTVAKSYRAVDGLIMITEMGAASGWGFSDPTNKGGKISIPLDSKQNLEATILMKTCKFTVGSLESNCPWKGPDPVLPAGVWSDPVRLEIDLSKSGNPKPKLIQVQFDTKNSEGTFPVKLQFTFAGWR
jgi:hypothetical protein